MTIVMTQLGFWLVTTGLGLVVLIFIGIVVLMQLRNKNALHAIDLVHQRLDSHNRSLAILDKLHELSGKQIDLNADGVDALHDRLATVELYQKSMRDQMKGSSG